MDITLLAALSASGVPGLNASDVVGLSASDVPGLSASDVPGLNASDVPALSASDVPGLRASDVPELNASDVLGLSASDVPALNASDVPGRAQQNSVRDRFASGLCATSHYVIFRSTFIRKNKSQKPTVYPLSLSLCLRILPRIKIWSKLFLQKHRVGHVRDFRVMIPAPPPPDPSRAVRVRVCL